MWQGVGPVCSIRVVYYANAVREGKSGGERVIAPPTQPPTHPPGEGDLEERGEEGEEAIEPFTFKDVKKTAMAIFETCYFGGSVTYRDGLTFSLDAYQFITGPHTD